MADGTSSWKWPRIIAILVFIACAIIAAIMQTLPAYVGLAVIFVLCVMMAFVGVGTPRHYAVGAFVVTAILVGAAFSAQLSWKVKGDFLKLAVPAALFGVSMLFWAEREDPKHWTKNVAAIIAAAIIATITYVCLFGDYVSFFSNLPVIGVIVAALFGLQKAAGKTWQWPLSMLAIAAIGAYLVRRSYPDLPDRLTSWIVQAGG